MLKLAEACQDQRNSTQQLLDTVLEPFKTNAAAQSSYKCTTPCTAETLSCHFTAVLGQYHIIYKKLCVQQKQAIACAKRPA